MPLPRSSIRLSLLTIVLLISVSATSQQSHQYISYFNQQHRRNSPEFESRKTDSLIRPSAKVRRNEPEDLQSLNQEVPNYDFEYQVHGGENVFGHVETRRESTTNGKYYVILPDFRRQVVSYYADETGYHATITYEPLPRPQGNIIDTLEQQKPVIRTTSALRNNLVNNQKEQRRVITRPNNRDLRFSEKSREEVQHRKQTRETPAEQILYALAQFEEHRHRQKNRSTSRRSFRRI